MRKQLGTLFVLAAAMPFIVGAGGMGPPPPSSNKVTGPAITATVVIDPHQVPVTTGAKRATIRLQKGSVESAATFDIPTSFVLNRGCDVGLSDLRFLYDPPSRPVNLYAWVPGNPFALDIVTPLFAPLGVIPDPGTNIPVITDINDVTCTVDPANPGVPDTFPISSYGPQCPAGGVCTNPNHQNIIVNGGDSSPALAGILSFTAVIQFVVPQNH
jgi:hypothetical protein